MMMVNYFNKLTAKCYFSDQKMKTKKAILNEYKIVRQTLSFIEEFHLQIGIDWHE